MLREPAPDPIRRVKKKLKKSYCLKISKDSITPLLVSFFLATSILSIALYTKCDEIDWLQNELVSEITKKDGDLYKIKNELDQRDIEIQKLNVNVRDLSEKNDDIQKKLDDSIALSNQRNEKIQHLNMKVNAQELLIQAKDSDMQRLVSLNDKFNKDIHELIVNVRDLERDLSEKDDDYRSCKVSLKETIETNIKTSKYDVYGCIGVVIVVVLCLLVQCLPRNKSVD